MLIFETIVTEGFQWEQDDQGNDHEYPVERTIKIKANEKTLSSLLRGIRRILENQLAVECYVILREPNVRMSNWGAVFELSGFDGATFEEMMEHHRRYLLYALAHSGGRNE